MTEVFSVVGLGVWPFFTPPKSRKPHYFNQKNRSRRCPSGLPKPGPLSFGAWNRETSQVTGNDPLPQFVHLARRHCPGGGARDRRLDGVPAQRLGPDRRGQL